MHPAAHLSRTRRFHNLILWPVVRSKVAEKFGLKVLKLAMESLLVMHATVGRMEFFGIGMFGDQ